MELAARRCARIAANVRAQTVAHTVDRAQIQFERLAQRPVQIVADVRYEEIGRVRVRAARQFAPVQCDRVALHDARLEPEHLVVPSCA